MLTDEELIARLNAAFHEGVPDLRYAGPVPHVRRGHTGLAATSALAAAAALVLTPAALQRGDEQQPPSSRPSAGSGTRLPVRHGVRTLDIAGLHLSSASVDGDPGDLYFTGGSELTVPSDAEKVDLGLPVEVFFADRPASGEPQVYISYRACPDTAEGCGGAPPPRHVYGILAPGWSRQQLMQLLEHPVRSERNLEK